MRDWDIRLWIYKLSFLREILQFRACDEKGNTVQGRESAYHAGSASTGTIGAMTRIGMFFFRKK